MANSYINKIFYNDFIFYPGFETFCYQNCQRILLEAQGIVHSELYINAALSLVYNKATNDIFTRDGIRTLLPSYQGKVKRFFYKSTEKKTKEVFFNNIEFMKKNDRAIIVGIDSYYLKYVTNYRKNHARHTLILCGFDLDKKEVYVIDWYPDWYYKGIVPIEDFLVGRESENPYDGTMFSGSSIENNWAYISDIGSAEPKVLIKELLDIILKEYYANDSCIGILYGIKALKALKEYIKGMGIADEFMSLYRKLNHISKRNMLFCQYLECYENITNIDELYECIKISKKIVDDWNIILMLFLKCSKAFSDKIRGKLLQRYEILIEDEEERKQLLIKLYKII